ncbi:hypothetical protein HMPREF3039_02258 [Akkermansia sp. KLE1798]|nr:hypothetical protein HMPREF3039_02258 [Akkermansia sp. KLE1798]KZA05730.1 hypothetical protein HMPREF1326_00556 [Akkermansia sp. KLE1605]
MGESFVRECVCTQVGERMSGCNQKEAETKRMVRMMAWLLLLGASRDGNVA